MSEPISPAVLGAVALTEGIKFLYGQAGDVLDRWRSRKAGRSKRDVPVTIDSSLLEGDLVSAAVDFALVEQLAGELAGLRGRLEPYLLDQQRIAPGDRWLLERADALRRVLELIYGQRLTFRGEDREPSGSVVSGRGEFETVRGRAGGLLIEDSPGVVRAHGEVSAREVGSGGEAFGAVVRRGHG